MKIKNKKYYTVYQITNLINKKVYIGFHSTNDLDDGYLGSGKLIKQAIIKYNPENFFKEYLAIFDNKEEAEKLESDLVDYNFVQRDDTYNLSLGGNVLILSGKNHYMYGKTWEEAIGSEKANVLREQVSKRFKGTVLTNSHKEKISFISKKRWSDPDFKQRMSNNRTGYTHSEETKMKISKSNTGKKLSKKHREIISENQKKRFKNMSKEEKILLYNEKRNTKISEKLKGRDTSSWQDRINKNPEKIKKTAEAHRGMKRSSDSKERMSNSQKGKRYFFHPNCSKRKRCVPGTEPEGWIRVNNK